MLNAGIFYTSHQCFFSPVAHQRSVAEPSGEYRGEGTPIHLHFTPASTQHCDRTKELWITMDLL